MLDLRKSHKVLDVRSGDDSKTLNLPVDTLIVSLLQISSLARVQLCKLTEQRFF